MTSVLVGGALANKAGQGGEAWVRMSWIRGLQRLGYDVCFVEQIRDEAATAEAVAYWETVVAAFGLQSASALITPAGRVLRGLAADDVCDRVEDAVALLDISGNLAGLNIADGIARRVYVDIDPGFTQIWHAQGLLPQVDTYDHHVTIAENIGTADCSIPTNLPWTTTRQPVVLEDWPVTQGIFDRFTTVSTWRSGFGAVEHDGIQYPLKHQEFRRFAEVPALADAPFEIALNIHPAETSDLALLRDNHWRVIDAAAVAATPHHFRRYVAGSGAEFSVAHGLYAHTNSGWFSDRSVRYLASGRPVLVQDTAAGRHLPVGEGLLVFSTPIEAAAAARRIVDDYSTHCEAARSVAERCFDSEAVLGRLADQLGLPR